MNDPNKKIEIDKSSLLSLKAELLRKQEEVSRAKSINSIDDFVPKKVPKAPDAPPSSSTTKTKSKPSKSTSSDGKASKQMIELEDSAQLERSKKVLIAKSKYYDRMMASGGSLNSEENCLVMFNQKKQTERGPVNHRYSRSSSGESASSDSSDEEDRRGPTNRLPERDDDIVEYTDFLGRSRKCLQKDLDDILRKDRQMEREASVSRGEPISNATAGPSASLRDDNSEDDDDFIGPPVPSMAITEDTIGERFREMREQWAKQQEANLEKDSVHYSDVLFDEARQHGVGYYAFSTDRDERNRQQLELDSIREATVDAQREKEDLRKARDKIIADRVKAAKARQRARLGLPPEEEAEKVPEVGRDELYDTAEEKKRAKAEGKAKKKKEKEERKREKEREKHVRPWDEGKEQDADHEWKPTKEWRVMSQEEWNEMKRSERIGEFAPPVDYASRWERVERNPLLAKPPTTTNPSVEEDDEDEESDDDQIGPVPPGAGYDGRMDDNPLLMPPPMTTSGDGGEPEEISMPTVPGMENIFLPEEGEEVPSRGALFFTTKKQQQKKEFKRRNYETVEVVAEKRPNLEQHRVPIRNELSEDEEEEEDNRRGEGGVEIAPPPTFDYYGPTGKGQKAARQKPVSKNALEASIEAGLKFLRNQSDKAGPTGGTKNKWTSNADY